MSLSSRTIRLLPVLAAALFGFLLMSRRLGPLDFWWGMSASLAVLVSLSLCADASYRALLARDIRRDIPRKIVLGLVSAIFLYLVFWAAGIVSREILPFADSGIEAVYAFKHDAPVVRVFMLVALVIGPGEEVFWRGFIQRRWEKRLGFPGGWLLASAFYAVVHIGSRNPILVLAALVCGLCWGALYSWSRSVLLVSISHTVWDLAVFIVFPLS